MNKKKKLGIKRKSKEAMDIEITSLLDILVILLVFLLSVYSSSDLDLVLVGNLTPPPSNSSIIGSKAIVIQVDGSKQIWIDGVNIGPRNLREWKNEIVQPLFQELQKENQKRNTTQVDKKKQRINIVLDEGLPYEIMHKVMHTSAVAGFSEFKFIVAGH